MVKVDTEFKLFHPMVKYNHLFNDLFFAPGISDSVIAFMGNSPLEGRQWAFKIPREKTWVLPEVKFCKNSIEIQTHFIQDSNRPFM